MAERPVFIPKMDTRHLVEERFFTHQWHSGFAATQKQKNIQELRSAAAAEGLVNLLEVSSKSDNRRGQHMSAFHMTVPSKEFGRIKLELAFQGSKVFEHGGPFTDLYLKNDKEIGEAKRDKRLKESGRLIGFNFEGLEFPLEPKTAFYDWLYISVLGNYQDWAHALYKYDGFTDVEFNPHKSINCQARSAALFVSLMKQNLLDEAIASPQDFLRVLGNFEYNPELRAIAKATNPNSGRDVSFASKTPLFSESTNSIPIVPPDAPTCFVIQPFDNGKFDKRFEETFLPAIAQAGFHAYRVDKDVRVEVPIEAIESGIRDSAICLADITMDNPNVWYELGFALAAGKPIVMVCSSEREGRYPFDIQHRSVIRYQVDARSDFEQLQSQITGKLKALFEKKKALQEITSADPVAPIAGLSQPEITVLATLAGNVLTPDSWESTHRVKDQAEREYLTSLGFTLALRRLIQKNLVEDGVDHDYRGEEFPALRVANGGWKWIDENESRFVIRKEIADADIPF